MRSLWHTSVLLCLMVIGASCEFREDCQDFCGFRYCMRSNISDDWSIQNYEQTLEDPVTNVTFGINFRMSHSIGYEIYETSQDMYILHDDHGKVQLLSDRNTRTSGNTTGVFHIQALGLISDSKSYMNHNPSGHETIATIKALSKNSPSEKQVFIPIGDMKTFLSWDLIGDPNNASFNENIEFNGVFEQNRRRFKVEDLKQAKSYESISLSSDVLSFERIGLQYGKPRVRGHSVDVVLQNITSHLFPEFSTSTTRVMRRMYPALSMYTVYKSGLLNIVMKDAFKMHQLFDTLNSTYTVYTNDGQAVSLTAQFSRLLKTVTLAVPTKAWSLTLVLNLNQTIRLTAYENDHFISPRWEDGEVLFDMEFNSFQKPKPEETPTTPAPSDDDYDYQNQDESRQSARVRVISKDLARTSQLLAAAYSAGKQFFGFGNPSNRTIFGVVSAFLRLDESAGIDQRFRDVITYWFQKRMDFFKQLSLDAELVNTETFELPETIVYWVELIERRYHS